MKRRPFFGLAPWGLCFAVFGVFPLAYALILSFLSYNPLRPDLVRWVGLDNYARALASPASCKGVLSALEAAMALAAGMRGAGLEAEELPVADGGESTAEVFAAMEDGPPLDVMLAAEPQPRVLLSPRDVDAAAEVIADFADLKSAFFAGHAAERAAQPKRRSRGLWARWICHCSWLLRRLRNCGNGRRGGSALC